MQVAGKSLRYTSTPSSSFANASNNSSIIQPQSAANVNKNARPSGRDFPMKDGGISINQVLYARHFRKKRVFSGSHELVKAAKSLKISKGVAGRLIRTIFHLDEPNGKQSKRLPKRLINLIPIIQSLITRFRDLDVEALVKSLLRVPPGFRKFMHTNQKLKEIAASTPSQVLANNLEKIHAMEAKAMDSEYLSQGESDDEQIERKRKRREQAIESRSCASAASQPLQPLSSTSRKRPRTTAQPFLLSGEEPGVTTNNSLVKLREHRDEISQLGEIVVPKKLVFRLLRKFVTRFIPKEIWGESTAKNWKCVKNLLERFVSSRKYDVISLKEVRASDFWCVKDERVGDVIVACSPKCA